MNENTSKLTRLLLGRVSEKERAQLEAELLHDDEAFETLLALDEELIDEYVVNGPSKDREELHRRFQGSPEMVEKVEFARAFASYTARYEPASDPGADPGERPASAELTAVGKLSPAEELHDQKPAEAAACSSSPYAR